jgi:hypothetical protein
LEKKKKKLHESNVSIIRIPQIRFTRPGLPKLRPQFSDEVHSYSPMETILSCRGYVAMFGCHNGIQRNTFKHPTTHRTAPMTQKVPTENVRKKKES